jgi:hypothetical protein
MARDKLITIRIEGEKREAFNQLAKSQNTDTASLLYDFISGCLDGRIDISLVTGKGNRLDNQLDDDRLNKIDNRIDGIETTTQRLAKRLDDWIEAFDDRLNDCDQGLSNKITSLEHRLNALSIQLDSQQNSQLDRQQENPDMGTVATVEAAIEKVEAVTDTVETAIDTVESDSIVEPDKGAIGPVTGDTDPIESVKGEGMNATDAAKYLKTKKVKVSYDSLNRWIGQEKIPDTSPQGRGARKHLILRDKLYYPIN